MPKDTKGQMPSEEKAVAEEAVEELAKRLHHAWFVAQTIDPQPWGAVPEGVKQSFRDEAHQTLTAIRPLLCGEEDRQAETFREKWQEADRLCGVACEERDEAERETKQAEQQLEQVQAERDEWANKAFQLGVGYFRLATSEPGCRAERAERQRDAALRERQVATQQLSEVRAVLERSAEALHGLSDDPLHMRSVFADCDHDLCVKARDALDSSPPLSTPPETDTPSQVDAPSVPGQLAIPKEQVEAKEWPGGFACNAKLGFWLCPIHGIFMPSRFDPEWCNDYGCPVPVSDEEPCDRPLTPVDLSSINLTRAEQAEATLEALTGNAAVRAAVRAYDASNPIYGRECWMKDALEAAREAVEKGQTDGQ